MRAHQASRTAVKIGRILVYLAGDPRRAPLLPPGMRDEPGRVDLRLRYLVPAGLDDLPLPTNERVLVAERR